LDEKAEEIRRITKHIKSLEKSMAEKKSTDDLRYIG